MASKVRLKFVILKVQLGRSSDFGSAPYHLSDVGQLPEPFFALVCSSVTWMIEGLREMSCVKHLECAGQGVNVPNMLIVIVDLWLKMNCVMETFREVDHPQLM